MIKIESPILPKKEGKVKFPVSYRYNGGTIVDGKWHEGFEVGDPVVPDGYELISLGIGLELNSKPPVCTMYLQKSKKAKEV